ncbi:lysophospholipid acyltransferase family protein [Streptomyces griseosporeus]|uniref:lysophospholipid acyltransferase family protein n=1 Tax=Streptomyces griseosporeus TaxID=1910 RepID=UPI00167C58F6|nr:lysophospholipid acyltransferase family protein [Streptomyces griseosporeus]GHF41664.1 1-acyl-sn-glycerol-3-phosphate acyltransferase [Streptomyces griseosporeus]
MSGWLPSAPCTPGACVRATARATAVPRAVLRLTGVVALLLTGIALAPLGARVPARAVRAWCRWLVRAAGVRVRVTGSAAPHGGLLLVANHISWLDVPLLAAVRPARMLAKREIRHWPVAGALAARGGALFIDRDRLRALPATVDRIAAVLRAGGTVAVFPEGSTWCGRAQGRFRRAVFQAALDADACVQPVRIRYRRADGGTATAPAFVGEDTLLASVWRVAVSRGLVAEVDVRPALAPGAHPDRRALARAAQHACVDSREPWHTAHPARAAEGPSSRTGRGVGTAGRDGAVRAEAGAVGVGDVTVGAGAVPSD